MNGSTVTIVIRDNGRGDGDPTAGKILDPGAPGVSAELPPTGTDVPGQLAFAGVLLAAGLALLLLRRPSPSA